MEQHPKLFRLTLTIHGLVQGVAFRYWAVETAKKLGLAGFARNEPNSTVKIVAEGEAPALAKLEKLCHTGPRFARVSMVDSEKKEIEELSYQSFTIQ